MTRSYRPLRLVVVILLLAVLLGFVAGTVGAPPSGPLGVATARAHRNPQDLPKSEMFRVNREDLDVRSMCGITAWYKCIWGLWAFHQSFHPVGRHGYHIRTWGWEEHIITPDTRRMHVTTRYIHNVRIRLKRYSQGESE